MIWKIVSFGSLDLLDGYDAWLDDADNPDAQPGNQLDVLSLGEAAPAEAGMSRVEDYLVVTIMIPSSEKRAKLDALTMAMDTLAADGQRLVGLDETGAEYYVMARVAKHTMKAMKSKIVVQVPDSVWRAVHEKTETWVITDSDQTFDINVGGTVEALPTYALTVTDAKTIGFAERQWLRTYNPNAVAILKEMVEVTIDTATLVTATKMQADCDDLRFYDAGKEVDCFISGPNTGTTRVFVGPFDFAPKIEMPILTAISGSGAVTAIYLKKTAANKKLLKRMPKKRGMVEVDNERFLYTSYDVAAMKLTISQRAVRHSSADAHSVGATLKWIEHDIWMYYANDTLEAPTVEDNHEPVYVLASSDNATRVYTSMFGDVAGKRPGAWRTAVLQSTGQESGIYTGEAGDETADPREVLGMAIKSFLRSGKPAAENATLECRYTHRGGITSVTVTGEKRRTSSVWPKFMGLQKSKDGKIFATQFKEAKPSSTSWAAITNTSTQTLGSGHNHIRFLAQGSVPAKLDAEADLEIDTVTIVITNPITAVLQGEEDNYELACELQNVTYDQSLFLDWTMGIDDTLTVDTETREYTYSDGTDAYRAKRLDAPRLEVLPLKPGVNQLKYIDAGTQGVTIVITYAERRKR